MNTVSPPAMVIPCNATILAVRNRHRQPAPDLQPIAGTDCYVSYFENATGNQWFFIRPDSATAGALYGSSTNWHPREVAGAPGADLGLDDNELSWLATAWATSEARRG